MYRVSRGVKFVVELCMYRVSRGLTFVVELCMYRVVRPNHTCVCEAEECQGWALFEAAWDNDDDEGRKRAPIGGKKGAAINMKDGRQGVTIFVV